MVPEGEPGPRPASWHGAGALHSDLRESLSLPAPFQRGGQSSLSAFPGAEGAAQGVGASALMDRAVSVGRICASSAEPPAPLGLHPCILSRPRRWLWREQESRRGAGLCLEGSPGLQGGRATRRPLAAEQVSPPRPPALGALRAPGLLEARLGLSVREPLAWK